MTILDEFLAQYENKQFFTTSFGKVEFRMVVSKNPKLIPVLFTPGWRETPEILQGCIFEVFKTGRTVITLQHPSKSHALEGYEDYPEIEARKAHTILDLIKHVHLSQVDIIAHSEGAINSAIAAKIQPTCFKNLVLITPAGLTGNDSLTRMALNYFRNVGYLQTTLSKLKHGLRKKEEYEKVGIFANAAFAIQEGKALTGFDIHPLLLELKTKGIRIALLLGETDTVFPYEKIRSHLASTKAAPNYGLNLVTVKPGGHKISTHPVEVIAQAIAQLEQLEKHS